MSRAVLDASAILALLRNETGAEVVEGYRGDALVSAVNIAEVAAKLDEQGIPLIHWQYALALIDLEVIAFDNSQALASASLRRSTRRRGLSLADRACLQLAAQRGLPAVTADRAWAELDVGVEVRVIRD